MKKLQYISRIPLYSLLIIIQTIVLMFSFPPYEYPDAFPYLNSLNNNYNFKCIYFDLLLYIAKKLNLDLNFQLNINDNFQGHISNTFIYDYSKIIDWNLIIFQVVNIIILLFSIILFFFMIRKSKDKHHLKLAIISYYLWPTINYYVLNISTDFIVYLYTPFFIYFILTNKHIFNIFICILIYLYVDSNIVTNILFVMIYYIITKIENIKSLKITENKKKFLIFLFITLFCGAIFFSRIVNFMPPTIQNIYFQIQEYYVNNSYLTKMVAFYISFIYGLGSGNFQGVIILYFIFLIYIIIILKKIFNEMNSHQEKERNNVNLFISGILTVITILLIVPNYANIKYYTYLIFLFNYFIIQYFDIKKELIFRIIIFIFGFISILKISINFIFIHLK